MPGMALNFMNHIDDTRVRATFGAGSPSDWWTSSGGGTRPTCSRSTKTSDRPLPPGDQPTARSFRQVLNRCAGIRHRMSHGRSPDEVRLAELVAALSLGTDLGSDSRWSM